MKKITTLVLLMAGITALSQVQNNGTDNSGTIASAIGISTTATGTASFSGGYISIASNSQSFAYGDEVVASGINATAFGSKSVASFEDSFAIGKDTQSSSLGSFAGGISSISSNNASLAFGASVEASGLWSTAFGGGSHAKGAASFVAGIGTTAEGEGNFTIGMHNTLTGDPDTTINRAFVIGNGPDNANRSDAMVVLFDGTTTINGNLTATSFSGDGSLLTNAGTDDQTLSLNVNTLELEDGGIVDLSGYLDNTDEQNITGSILTGTTLTIGIEGGTSEDIDLSLLLSALEAENAAQQAQLDAQQALIEDLITRMEVREQCECTPLLDVSDFNLTRNQAYLSQNVPNPFDNTTSVGYFIPLSYSKANIVVSTTTGQLLKNINITKFGEGAIEINKERMATALYYYTLYVDGKKVDTKRMIVE